MNACTIKAPDDRSDEHAAERAAVQVADNFFENEGDRGEGGIENRRQTGGGAGRARAATILFRNTEKSGQARGEIAADLHSWTFATEALSAADSNDTGDKLDPGDAPRRRSEFLPVGEFDLRNPASGQNEFKSQPTMSEEMTMTARLIHAKCQNVPAAGA